MVLLLLCLLLVLMIVVVVGGSLILFNPKLVDLIAGTSLKANYDAISIAVEIGRLDVISVLLGIIAIFMAVFGVFGYSHIKIRSERIAEDTARKISKEIAPQVAKEVADDAAREAINIRLDYMLGKNKPKDPDNKVKGIWDVPLDRVELDDGVESDAE